MELNEQKQFLNLLLKTVNKPNDFIKLISDVLAYNDNEDDIRGLLENKLKSEQQTYYFTFSKKETFPNSFKLEIINQLLQYDSLNNNQKTIYIDLTKALIKDNLQEVDKQLTNWAIQNVETIEIFGSFSYNLNDAIINYLCYFIDIELIRSWTTWKIEEDKD